MVSTKKNEFQDIIDNSKTFCIIPVIGPALNNIEFVVEYLARVINNQAVKIEIFDDLFKIASNPALLSDDDIWPVILRIVKDYNVSHEDTFDNPMWDVLKCGDESNLLRKLTGLMLRVYDTQILKRMMRTSGLPLHSFVPSEKAALLQKLLSWIFVPVLIPIKNNKVHATFYPTSIAMFHNIKHCLAVYARKRSLTIWTVKKERKAFVMDEISSIVQYTTFWHSFQSFVASIPQIKFQASMVGQEESLNQSITLESQFDSISLEENSWEVHHLDDSFYRLYNTSINQDTKKIVTDVIPYVPYNFSSFVYYCMNKYLQKHL